MDCIIYLLEKHIEAKARNNLLNVDDEIGDADEFKKNMKML